MNTRQRGPLEGGCQCGAIRYRIDQSEDDASSPEQGDYAGAHYCHCRMCQKALGNVVGVWLPVKAKDLQWIKGDPKYYQSSPFLERGFCGDCGTPLGARYVEGLENWEFADLSGVLAGTLDDPNLVRPAYHFGIESQVDWFAVDDDLPRRRTDDLPGFADLWHQDGTS